MSRVPLNAMINEDNVDKKRPDLDDMMKMIQGPEEDEFKQLCTEANIGLDQFDKKELEEKNKSNLPVT